MQTGYTRAQIAIHWAVAVLIIANYFISEGMGDVLDKMGFLHQFLPPEVRPLRDDETPL